MRELMRLKSAGAVFWCWGAGADFEYASVIAGGYGQKIYVAPIAAAGAISILFLPSVAVFHRCGSGFEKRLR